MQDTDKIYCVRIPWKMGDNITTWDDICAWAIEQFGLPGQRFFTHPCERYLEFNFFDEKDALFFRLRWE